MLFTSFDTREKVFLDFFNDFLGLGDSFHNQISDECINFSSINLDKGSNFVDLGADLARLRRVFLALLFLLFKLSKF